MRIELTTRESLPTDPQRPLMRVCDEFLCICAFVAQLAERRTRCVGRVFDSHRWPWSCIFRNWSRLSLRKCTHLQKYPYRLRTKSNCFVVVCFVQPQYNSFRIRDKTFSRPGVDTFCQSSGTCGLPLLVTLLLPGQNVLNFLSKCVLACFASSLRRSRPFETRYRPSRAESSVFLFDTFNL